VLRAGRGMADRHFERAASVREAEKLAEEPLP